MSRLKVLKKDEHEGNINSYQPHIFDDEKTREREACRYRASVLLSDTPKGTSIEDYPYVTVENGVKLHDVFLPIFNGKIPVMSKESADELCARHIGYDGRSGYPVRIYRDSIGIVIKAFSPSGEVLIMDCFTGNLEREK